MTSENLKQTILKEFIDYNISDTDLEDLLNEYAKQYHTEQLQLGVVADELCECGGSERVALDCTMELCKHPKYYKK